MGRWSRILALGAMLSIAWSPALAQDGVRVSSQIAIVSIEKILSEARVAQDLRAQSEQARGALRADITARDAALKIEEEALVELRDALQADQIAADGSGDTGRLQELQIRRAAFEARARAFENNVRTLRRTAQIEGDRLKESYSRAMGELRVAINPALLDAMRARGAAVLLDESVVIISDTALDLTNDVIARLNASNLRIRFAAPSAPTTAP